MSARRLAAVLAAVLAGLLLAAALFLRHQRVQVRVDSESGPAGAALPSLPAPPEPELPASAASGGTPACAAPAYTNEMQEANLERQKAAQGIRSLAPPPYSASARQELLEQAAQAQTPDEAVSALRQLSLMNQAARAQAGRRGPVSLNGTTPKLLAEPSAGEEEKGGPLPTMDWFVTLSSSPGKSRVVSDEASWTALWKRLFPGTSAPDVDFSRQAVALAVAGPHAAGDGLEILSAGEEGGSFVIRYRQTRSLSAAAFPGNSARWLCALKKIPRPSGAVRFLESR